MKVLGYSTALKHHAKLNLINLVRKELMSIQDVDLAKSELESFKDIKTQFDISSKLDSIYILVDARFSNFVKNLIKLENDEQGIIFIVGKSHQKQYQC